jgi:hypothetical protein
MENEQKRLLVNEVEPCSCFCPEMVKRAIRHSGEMWRLSLNMQMVCGPYHPNTIALMTENNLNCFYCGTSMREHK